MNLPAISGLIDGRSGSERQRFSRIRFLQFSAGLAPARIILEACGSAHHWARWFSAHGHEVVMLPAQHVRAYRRGNKTDRADALALLQADRMGDIKPVPVKGIEQQSLQHPHRLREQWKATRTARINALRGILREHGHAFPAATDTFLANAMETVDADPALAMLRPALHALQAKFTFLEEQMEAACARALAIGAKSRRSVLSILQGGLDRQPLPAPVAQADWVSPEHDNLRGPDYYLTTPH